MPGNRDGVFKMAALAGRGKACSVGLDSESEQGNGKLSASQAGRTEDGKGSAGGWLFWLHNRVNALKATGLEVKLGQVVDVMLCVFYHSKIDADHGAHTCNIIHHKKA